MEKRPLRQLKSKADYSVDMEATIVTPSNEDHTFYGIMFDVEAKNDIPIENLQIRSFSVRGRLGKVKVYYTETSHEGKFHLKDSWRLVYNKELPESLDDFTELRLAVPIVIPPGEKYGVYIRSDDDNGILYDDERNPVTFENTLIKVHSGMASVSSTSFGPTPDKISWRWPWRPNREFVGKISFGIRYVLWRPIGEIHRKFPSDFQRGALNLLSCSGKGEMNKMVKDVTLVLLNMLRFDWFDSRELSEIINLKPLVRMESNPKGWQGDWRVYQERIYQHMKNFGETSGYFTIGEEGSDESDDDEFYDDDEMEEDES